MPETAATIDSSILDFVAQKEQARSQKTARTYRYGLSRFARSLADQGLQVERAAVNQLNELHVIAFIESMQAAALSAATQKLYCSALIQFYKYLAARSMLDLNLHRLEELVRQHVRRPGQRLPQFPKDDIQAMIGYAQSLRNSPVSDPRDRRINLRDRAFLITLADTGLRVHEACGLQRGDIDWNEGRAVIIGKGDKQAVVRFSQRSIQALRDYLSARAELDGATGRRLASLPLFARHDDGGERKVKPISTDTGRNIVKRRVREALGNEATGTITPHSFRHYFVTTVLQATGGNIHVAQKLARHTSISITERYAHLADDELDRSYHQVFE